MRRDLVISSELLSIEKVRLFLEGIFEEVAIDRKLFNRVFLGLSEAVHNSIIHGNKLDEDKQVYISVYVFDRLLVIEVQDEGDGFSFECIEDPTTSENLCKENGRGIFLIKSMSDHLKYSDDGRSVEIKYHIG